MPSVDKTGEWTGRHLPRLWRKPRPSSPNWYVSKVEPQRPQRPKRPTPTERVPAQLHHQGPHPQGD
eukprot:468864-Pyramimonas_sp.AAC.1